MIEVRSPLKWIGGKSASAERIVDAFPSPASYDTYVEPCCGALHVFFAKPSYGHQEVLNDADDNLITFWQEVQVHGQELQESLDQHLFSRKLYYEYYRSLSDGTELTSFERAVRWFYCLRGTGTGWMRKSPPGWVGKLDSGVQSYRSVLDLFLAIQERLKYVSVDNRDVLATIKRYATTARNPERVFLYIDPPYFGAEQYYESSKKGFPHEEMATLLQEVKGYVALSYYPHPSIDMWYPAEKWRRVSWQQVKSSQIQLDHREEDIATEMLLCNYSQSPGLWG